MKDLSDLNLNNLLEDKKTFLLEILNLTKSQTIAIKQEKIEELESILDKKSIIIEKIDDLDYKFKDCLGDNKIEDKVLLSSIDEIKIILIDIKEIDDKNNENLSYAMANMKEDLKDVRQGQRAMKNYGNADPYQSFASLGGTLFIDQDS